MTGAPEPHPIATPRIAAGALFVDERGWPLLVKPAYKEGWDLPGGYVEPGESPRAAGIRELEEELSIRRTLDVLLVVDWAPNEHEGDKILFVFDGGTMSPQEAATLELQADELLLAQHVDPAALHEHLPARLLRRVTLALEARRADRTVYAEHGTV